MHPAFSRDLLSASIDGEATSAEQATLNEAIAGSVEMKSELDGFRTLSEQVGSLPTESAPVGFADSVIASLDRPTVREPVTPASPAQSSAWKSAIVVLTAAAAVLVMVQFSDDASSEPAMVSSAAVAVPDVETGVHTRATDLRITHNSAADSNAAVSASDDQPDRDAVQARRFTLPGNAEDAQIGDVIEMIERSGHETTVVRLTVVDRQQGLEKLELLLSHNRIEQDGAASESMDNESGLVAVYVESDTDRFAQALQAMNDESEFQGLDVEPVQLAALDRSMVPGEPSGGFTSRPETAVASPALDAGRVADAAETDLDRAAGKGSAAERDAGTPASMSRYRRFVLHRDRLRSSEERGSAAVRSSAGDSPKSRSAKEQRDARPIQVLIVLETASESAASTEDSPGSGAA